MNAVVNRLLATKKALQRAFFTPMGDLHNLPVNTLFFRCGVASPQPPPPGEVGERSEPGEGNEDCPTWGAAVSALSVTLRVPAPPEGEPDP